MAEALTYTEEETAAESDLFRKALQADFDAGMEPPDSAKQVADRAATAPETDETQPGAKAEGEKEKLSAELAPKQRDDKGRFTPKAQPQAPTTPEPQAAPEKAESDYAKAQKEEERQRNLLHNFQQEKEEWRALRQQQEQEYQRRMAQLQQQAAPARAVDKDGFDAPAYRKYSLMFHQDAIKAARENDPEKAFQNSVMAYQAMMNAQNLEVFEYQKQNEGLARWYDGSFRQDMEKVIREHPETHPDSGDPIVKEIHDLLNSERGKVLYWVPEGFQIAYEIALMRRDSGASSALRQEINELKEQLAEANRGSQPLSSRPTTHSEPRTMQDVINDPNISDEQKEAMLARRAEELDAMGVAAMPY